MQDHRKQKTLHRVKYVVKEFRRHFWRTFFSILGYAVASVFILFILCISGSNKNDSFGLLQSTGTHFIVYIPTDVSCCTSGKGNGTVFAEGVKTMMLDADMVRTIRNVEGVRDAAPCLLYKMYHDRFRSEISIAGIDTNSIATGTNACHRSNLVDGRFLSGIPDEVVATQSFAAAHNLSPGDTLDIFGGRMILAGIVNAGIRPVDPDFFAPIDVVRSILKEKLECNAPSIDMNVILVEVADSRVQDKVITHIRNMMYKFAVSSYNCYQPAFKVMSIIDKSSIGLTFMIFLFLVIFSVKTQLTALMERFREIGILKSLGWSDLTLSAHIFIVSFIQAIIGVTVGLIIGIGVILVLREFEISPFRSLEFNLQYASIPLIYILSLSGAFIAGLFPVIKILRSKAGDIIKNYM